MKCPSCGKEIPYGAKFCQHCGIRIATDFSPSRAAGPDASPNESPEEPVFDDGVLEDVAAERNARKQSAASADAALEAAVPEEAEVVDLAAPLEKTAAADKAKKPLRERNLFIPVTALFCALAILAGVLGYRLSASPQRAVQDYFRAVQRQDWEKAEQLSVQDPDGMSLPAMADGLRDAMQTTDESWNFYRAFMKKLCDFEYDVVEAETNGNHATVTVKLSTYDFGPFSESAMAELYEYIMLSMFSVFGSNADYDDTDIMKTLNNALNKVGDKRVEKTVKIPVVKEDGKWKVGGLSMDTTDAITGGLLSGLLNGDLFGEDSFLNGVLDGFDFSSALDGFDFSGGLNGFDFASALEGFTA